MLSLPFLLLMFALLVLALVVPSPIRRSKPVSDPLCDIIPEPEGELPTERLQRLSDDLNSKACQLERHARKAK